MVNSFFHIFPERSGLSSFALRSYEHSSHRYPLKKFYMFKLNLSYLDLKPFQDVPLVGPARVGL